MTTMANRMHVSIAQQPISAPPPLAQQPRRQLLHCSGCACCVRRPACSRAAPRHTRWPPAAHRRPACHDPCAYRVVLSHTLTCMHYASGCMGLRPRRGGMCPQWLLGIAYICFGITDPTTCSAVAPTAESRLGWMCRWCRPRRRCGRRLSQSPLSRRAARPPPPWCELGCNWVLFNAQPTHLLSC